MKTEVNVIVIDDDADFSESLVQLLEVDNLHAIAFRDPEKALQNIKNDFNGVVLLDMRMPRISGEDVLKKLIALDAALPVIHITGHGDIPMAVRALKEGAYGFFTKPLQIDDLLRDIRRALASRSIEIERRKLARQIEMRDGLVDVVVGTSPNMVALRQLILKVGSASVDVLVQGETGSGKELVARALANVSARRAGPFVAVNCGSFTDERRADELFGMETFTQSGEKIVQPGRIERASGGTVLLDEIESMPMEVQVQLLRVLQERTIERINGVDEVSIDVRFIAATKANLQDRVEKGLFREDLFYRLDGATLTIPPLRERSADPVILFERFLMQHENGEASRLTPSLMSDLLSHDWPGNVRELKNAADRYASGLYIFSEDAPARTRSDSLSARVAEFEKGLIEATLAHNSGSIKCTMLDLDVPRKTLSDKINKYSIKRETYLPG